MSSEPVIEVEGLGKAFLINAGQLGHKTFREALAERARNPLVRRSRELFWALEDINFVASAGEVVGLIGGNGAGKSTLLKILCRITEPTKGRAQLRGRVGSLLEVGTGFHPDLTGRENIFLNGAILGMPRAEILQRFPEIVEFSGIGMFLDTPVKRYSSGMYVRLAFAVAAHLQPEILLVDEVLAVGDAEFQRRCLGKMEDAAREEGRTIIFVSHNLAAVESLCSRAIFLREGAVVVDGDVNEAIGEYLRGRGGELGQRDLGSIGSVHFRSIAMRDEQGNATRQIRMNAGAEIVIRLAGLQDPSTLVFGMNIRSAGTLVSSVSSRMYPTMLGEVPDQDLTFRFAHVPLTPGTYTVDIGFKRRHEPGFVDFVPHALEFEVEATDLYGNGYRATQTDGMVFLPVEISSVPIDRSAP